MKHPVARKNKFKMPIPFEFVLDELSGLDLHTRPMFGCTAVYVGSKIVLVLRKKEKKDADTGIWVCIPDEFVPEMKKRFPLLRGVSFFENENSAWQNLPEECPAFEELALELCGMIKKGTPLIGRVPKQKKPRVKRRTKAKSCKSSAVKKK